MTTTATRMAERWVLVAMRRCDVAELVERLESDMARAALTGTRHLTGEMLLSHRRGERALASLVAAIEAADDVADEGSP